MVLWLVILGGCFAVTGAFVGLVALGRWWKPAPYLLIVVGGAAGLAWILASDARRPRF